jgi:acyl carrier protein
MNSAISNTLSQYIATQILKQPSRDIAPTEKLISSGMIDSFNLVDLSLFVEESFGVRLDDTELTADTFDTLAELEQIILQRQS